jgi:hypothetical protein
VLVLLGGISVALGLKTLSENGAWSTLTSGLILIALGPLLDRAVQRAIRRTRDELARLNNSHEPGEPGA